MSIQQLFTTWWFSGVVLPVFFSVVIGGLVNLWAGIVTAEILTFRQIIRETLHDHDLSEILVAGAAYQPLGPQMFDPLLEQRARMKMRHAQLVEIGQVQAADALTLFATEFESIVLQLQTRPHNERLKHEGYLRDVELIDVEQAKARMIALKTHVASVKPDYPMLFLRALRFVENSMEAKPRTVI